MLLVKIRETYRDLNPSPIDKDRSRKANRDPNAVRKVKGVIFYNGEVDNFIFLDPGT